MSLVIAKRYFVHWYEARLTEMFGESIAEVAKEAEKLMKTKPPGSRLHQILEDKPPATA